jgi:glucose-1-phosphate adenylyltransferase
MIKDTFGLIMAGDENPNLRELVLARAAAAMPIGGRYRVIDFLLSNMVNSGIRNVGVITQKNYQSLMDHLGSGKDWDLSRKRDGIFMLPPYDNSENTGIYKGSCDAIKGNMSYIKRAPQEYCLLTGVGNIYTTTYNKMLRRHLETQADITLLYHNDEDRYSSENYQDLRVLTDEDGRVTAMEYNFAYSKSDKRCMDVFLIHKSLLEYLVNKSIAYGHYDFINDVLVKNVKNLKMMAIEHTGYVGKLDSVKAYYKVNLDLLNEQVQSDLFYTGNPVYTKIKDEAPVKYREYAMVRNSLLADGCIVNGEVEDSILFRGVHVSKDAKVKDCVIMQNVEIGKNCYMEHVIADKNCIIRDGKRLIGSRNYPMILQKGSVI